MGIARLLAKGWLFFCAFAFAHALARTLPTPNLIVATGAVGVPVLLFGAMGVLFIAGYGLSSGHLLTRFRPQHLWPQFNEAVFLAFAAIVLAISLMPGLSGWPLGALEAGVRFAIPGQRAFEDNLARCGAGGTLAFTAAVSWTLAFVFLGSAASRLQLDAALVRIERKRRIEPLGASGIALILGVVSVLALQFLFVGTIYSLLPCPVLSGLTGAVLAGAAPLMLAYLIAAALINLVAMNPES